MSELGDEDMYGQPPRAQITQQSLMKNIGYYFEDGRRKFGVIPDRPNDQTNINYGWIRTTGF